MLSAGYFLKVVLGLLFISLYIYDEIHEFQLLEVWIEMNVYVPYVVVIF